jgi:hypothetical protein
MKTSDSIKALAVALKEAQNEMGGAVKDSKNPFYKSNYADLTAVLKAIKEPLAKHGFSFCQFPISDEQGVGVCTRLMHISGEWIENEFVLPLLKPDPQAAGAAITYARRYALASITGIPQVDDDAESLMLRNESSIEDVPPQHPPLISDFHARKIKRWLKDNDKTEDKFCQYYEISSVRSMTTEQFEHWETAFGINDNMKRERK